MSAGHFHGHGPHDHEIEHPAQSSNQHGNPHGDKDSFAGRVATLTAVLATVGALMS